jgi:serine protease Do
VLVTILLLAVPGARAQGAAPPAATPRAAPFSATGPLVQLDAALKELTAKVAPAVVQVVATGYGPTGGSVPGQAAVFTRQQGVGSGVVLDPSGYIVTNAHVVKGAERVEVVLTHPAAHPEAPIPPQGEQETLPATVVGFTDYFDLALLKVEAEDLTTLPFADIREVTQGQVVIAVGSPLGLDNSVTMGIVSSVARQAKPDSPVVFVQTDAPINPGNSGGALVDVNGRLVGVNTFILSQTGGNEGLGFALPAPIVRMAYRSLREKGHVDRRVIGVGIQQISPALARGLGLPRGQGLVVCDLVPGGPGEQAGLKIGDVLVEAGGWPILTPSQLDGSLYSHDLRQPMTLGVLRGVARLDLHVQVREEAHEADALLDPGDPRKNLVRALGVLAVTVTPELQARAGSLRIGSGVAVLARTTDTPAVDLAAGDVVHAVNGAPVESVEALRDALASFKRGESVALQVERRGGLEYVAFEMN